jgi:hypothetical protein
VLGVAHVGKKISVAELLDFPSQLLDILVHRFQERQIADMAEIKTLVNKMPELTGQIVRSIVAEMKRGE